MFRPSSDMILVYMTVSIDNGRNRRRLRIRPNQPKRIIQPQSRQCYIPSRKMVGAYARDKEPKAIHIPWYYQTRARNDFKKCVSAHHGRHKKLQGRLFMYRRFIALPNQSLEQLRNSSSHNSLCTGWSIATRGFSASSTHYVQHTTSRGPVFKHNQQTGRQRLCYPRPLLRYRRVRTNYRKRAKSTMITPRSRHYTPITTTTTSPTRFGKHQLLSQRIQRCVAPQR